jgi:hypothetical protein
MSKQGNKAVCEIRIDSGPEAGFLDEEGMLVCTASVESMMVPGNAEIDVECKDEKFAANVQACLRNVAATMIPTSRINSKIIFTAVLGFRVTLLQQGIFLEVVLCMLILFQESAENR